MTKDIGSIAARLLPQEKRQAINNLDITSLPTAGKSRAEK